MDNTPAQVHEAYTRFRGTARTSCPLYPSGTMPEVQVLSHDGKRAPQRGWLERSWPDVVGVILYGQKVKKAEDLRITFYREEACARVQPVSVAQGWDLFPTEQQPTPGRRRVRTDR